MKLAHKIKISVFVKPEDRTDNPQIDGVIQSAIRSMIPLDLEKEKLAIKKDAAEGFNNRTIIIYSVELLKEAHTNSFIEYLLSKLNPDQKDLLLRQAESRLDENLDFFIRLGKQELLRGDYYITDSGDCFHIKIGIAAFPKKREAAVRVVQDIFNKSSTILSAKSSTI